MSSQAETERPCQRFRLWGHKHHWHSQPSEVVCFSRAKQTASSSQHSTPKETGGKGTSQLDALLMEGRAVHVSISLSLFFLTHPGFTKYHSVTQHQKHIPYVGPNMYPNIIPTDIFDSLPSRPTQKAPAMRNIQFPSPFLSQRIFCSSLLHPLLNLSLILISLKMFFLISFPAFPDSFFLSILTREYGCCSFIDFEKEKKKSI